MLRCLSQSRSASETASFLLIEGFYCVYLESGIIWKGWKRKYCVLYNDGEFSMYDGVADATANTRINMKTDCHRLEVGQDCGTVALPKNREKSLGCLFGIFCDGKKSHYFLCASQEECR